MEYEMTLAEIIEWQDSEFPQCAECDGRIGMDCTCPRNDAGDRVEVTS